MTHQPVAPSRRTVLRAAAWSAPAVSIAVAAPAFATSHETPPLSVTGPLGIDRHGTVLRLATALEVSHVLTGVTAVVTLRYVGANATHITSTSVAAPWSTSTHGVASANFTAASLPVGTTSFRPHINLDNTSFDSVEVTVTFTWAGSGQGVTSSATYSKNNSLP